jgi:hypothetical protein
MRSPVLTVLSVLLATAASAGAAVYFVSPSGSDAAPGTLVAPWRTIATANATVVPGDTVRIRAGTYAETIAPHSSGTADRRITYRAHERETVVLTAADHGIAMRHRAHITVDGIDCRGTQTFVLLDDSHHIWIRNAVLDGAALQQGGPKGIRIVNDSHHNRIERCWIGRAGYVAVAPSKTGLQDRGGLINIGNDTEPGDDSHFNLIEGNTLAYGAHHVLLVASRYNVIRNNYIHNEPWMPDPTDPSILYGNRGIGGGGPNSSRNLVEANRIAFAGPPPDDDGAYGIERASGHNIYRRNLIYANGTAGIGLHSKWHGETSDNYVYANTFHRNGVAPSLPGFHKGAISVQNYNGETPRRNAIKNNLFHDNVAPDDRFHSGPFAVGGNVRLEDQIVAGNWRGADPGFVDIDTEVDPTMPDLPDFRLQPGSPCIDAGVFLTHAVGDGESDVLAVADAGYFTDGWGIVEADRIQLQGGPARARVVGVDYEANHLHLDRSLSWHDGQGVSLAYGGSAPDAGAYEVGVENLPAAPSTSLREGERVLFQEDFDDIPKGSVLPDGWWVEGGEHVAVRDGRLHVRADGDGPGNRVCTVWLDRVFAGDLRVELDAHVLASRRRVNNINFFFLYSDPSGVPLRQTAPTRADAAYGSYHDLDGYIITFLQDLRSSDERWPDGTPKGRVRLRRCPGFQLVDEVFDYHCRRGVTYRLTVTRRGDRLSYAVDGVVLAHMEDPDPLAAGSLGLRTFGTELWWDRIIVTELPSSP